MMGENRMAKPLQEELTEFHAGICQALADTTRIAILYELAEGRKNVGQLVEALGSPQATISRHLKVLRERGMVNNERDGVHIYYSLADQRIIEALDLLRGVMADILARRKQLAEALMT
jgi:DNA-binding transcriptional ArsR family regulator